MHAGIGIATCAHIDVHVCMCIKGGGTGQVIGRQIIISKSQD